MFIFPLKILLPVLKKPAVVFLFIHFSSLFSLNAFLLQKCFSFLITARSSIMEAQKKMQYSSLELLRYSFALLHL